MSPYFFVKKPTTFLVIVITRTLSAFPLNPFCGILCKFSRKNNFHFHQGVMVSPGAVRPSLLPSVATVCDKHKLRVTEFDHAPRQELLPLDSCDLR